MRKSRIWVKFLRPMAARISPRSVDFLLNEVLAHDPRVFAYRFKPGEAVICNNILHNRTGFTDRPDTGTRLVYRGRYMDRVADIITGEIT